MMLDALKEEVCELPLNGLVAGSDGNASGCGPDSGLVAIKPSGVSFSRLSPDQMAVVDLADNPVEGTMKPSADTGIRLHVFRHRGDVRGICHTHPPCATSFAARGERNPAVLAPITHILGRDVSCSDCAAPGEVETGQAIVDASEGRWAVPVKAHGVFTTGKSATEATSIALYIEDAAKTTHLAMLRGPLVELSEREMARCCAWFRRNHGQRGRS